MGVWEQSTEIAEPQQKVFLWQDTEKWQVQSDRMQYGEQGEGVTVTTNTDVDVQCQHEMVEKENQGLTTPSCPDFM